RPKVRLPRALRSRCVKHVGEQINLVIPFIGKPKPVISWTKDGQPLDTKKVNIRNSDKDSILFIRKSEREDSGSYEMTVKVDSFEDKASLIIQIVDLPGPPASVKLVDSWGFNAALEWTAPKDNGNTEITGYTIQKADKKTGEWFTVLEHFHRLNATVSDLVMGNTYTFRVFAENKVGRSETAAVTKDAAHIQKTGIVYKPLEYKEHDFSEAPKFTAPLSNRAATVGYTTKLLCAVRGSPKPKIEWLKNQMLIGDDPKYRQINNQGVCSLEIRKPSSFDGGVYTCRAKNALGEATVACKLEVKQPPVQIPKPQITLNVAHKVLYKTERVTLSCEVTGGPPGLQYDWYKNSEDLGEHQHNITASDSGKYECKATKGAMSEKSDSYTLTLEDPPQPQVRSDWTEAFHGEKVSLQCVIQASENWNYMWFKGQNKIVSNDETNIQGNTLTLSVQSSHDGEYVCQAELQGRKVTTAKSTPYSLTVRELPKPELSITPEWKTFYPTEKLTLKCSVKEDSDKWGYEWFRNGAPLPKDKDKDISFPGNTLSISSAKAVHSGQYTCRGRHLKRTPVTTGETGAVQLLVYGK
ncbi:hypothetical protein cypCar_00042318, partial [Cyprinus carpio]